MYYTLVIAAPTHAASQACYWQWLFYACHSGYYQQKGGPLYYADAIVDNEILLGQGSPVCLSWL
jgi:hypothetical protein